MCPRSIFLAKIRKISQFSSENNHFYSCEISQYMRVFVMPVRQYILFSCKRISYTDFATDIFDLKEKIHAFQLRALNLGHFFLTHAPFENEINVPKL